MKHDDFAFDWLGIDGTAILALVLPPNIIDLKVPLMNVRSDDRETMIIYNTAILKAQRKILMIYPRDLKEEIE